MVNKGLSVAILEQRTVSAHCIKGSLVEGAYRLVDEGVLKISRELCVEFSILSTTATF
jgi:hypothetical protein